MYEIEDEKFVEDVKGNNWKPGKDGKKPQRIGSQTDIWKWKWKHLQADYPEYNYRIV